MIYLPYFPLSPRKRSGVGRDGLVAQVLRLTEAGDTEEGGREGEVTARDIPR